MRRGGTLLVVVVVAAIAIAAGVDALRGDSGPEPAARSEPEEPNASTTTTSEPAPAAAPFGGVLYYTDESCQLRAAQLPGLDAAEAPNWDECAFVLSPDGRRVAGEGSGWDPHSDPLRGRLFEFVDGRIQVSTNAGPEGEPFSGEAPAWRPDGTLTYFADRAVREWPSGRVVLSQRDLRRALRQTSVPGLGGFRRIRVREAAWLGDRRLAAILSVEGPSGSWDVLTSFDDGGLQEVYVETPGRFADLRASPAGRYFAARRGQDGVILSEPGRGEVGSLGIVGYRAIAWSPDEQWAAVAAESGVFVFRPSSSRLPELELELDAHDLDWRGDSGPPTIAEADAAREWLEGVGATGRLVLAQSDESGCAVRALRLPGLEWAERPPGPSERCRFTLDYRGVVVPESIVPRPGRGEWAECREGAVEWANESGPVGRYQSACAPEWTPDGRLTFVRDGSVYQAWTTENGRVLLPRGKLGELMGRPSSLEEIAWLDDERFWAVVRSGESAIVALLTTERLVFSPSFTTREIEDLQVSATGMVAARTDQGVVFFDSGGRRALTFPNAHAVAWAPGELFAAVATPGEVLFVAPVSREVVPVSLAVRDLEWVVP
jgi:hypothetical protein